MAWEAFEGWFMGTSNSGVPSPLSGGGAPMIIRRELPKAAQKPGESSLLLSSEPTEPAAAADPSPVDLETPPNSVAASAACSGRPKLAVTSWCTFSANARNSYGHTLKHTHTHNA